MGKEAGYPLKEQLLWPVCMPKIPSAFLAHDKIKYVLHHTIQEFNFEEQQAIRFYCVLGLPISELTLATGLTPTCILSVLTLFAERLRWRLNVFMQAIPTNPNDSLPVSDMLTMAL